MSDSNQVLVYSGNQRVAGIAPQDRGLAYGDGLFETMRIHQGKLPWWPAHWARLSAGAARLHLPLPDAGWLRAQTAALIAGRETGVLKLILTRGVGDRGYAPPEAAVPTLLLSTHSLLPAAPAAGLRLRWCQLRLAAQPLLAGLKHCNRLEQVLARGEWRDPEIHEGLLCDDNGQVIGATAGNLFALFNGRWLTPRLDRCGVAGVLRAWLLANISGVEEAELSPADVEHADGLFIGNAVRGILPVTQLETRHWPSSPAILAIQQALAAQAPMFADLVQGKDSAFGQP